MELICGNCKQILANVKVLIPFGAAVSCGECGTTLGHNMLVETVTGPPLTLDEQIAQVEDEIETAAAKLKALKATPRPPIAASGS